jgi:hypothetical protein
MHTDYRNRIRQLRDQQVFCTAGKKIEQVDRASSSPAEPDRTTPEYSVSVTSCRSPIRARLSGRGGTIAVVERISGAADVPADTAGERVLMTSW